MLLMLLLSSKKRLKEKMDEACRVSRFDDCLFGRFIPYSIPSTDGLTPSPCLAFDVSLNPK